MVVPVLITSCQTSENWNIGPVTAHTSTQPNARMKVSGLPASEAIFPAILVKILFMRSPRETPEGLTRIQRGAITLFSIAPIPSISQRTTSPA